MTKYTDKDLADKLRTEDDFSDSLLDAAADRLDALEKLDPQLSYSEVGALYACVLRYEGPQSAWASKTRTERQTIIRAKRALAKLRVSTNTRSKGGS